MTAGGGGSRVGARLLRPFRRWFWTRSRMARAARRDRAFDGSYARWLVERDALTSADREFIACAPGEWSAKPRMLVVARAELGRDALDRIAVSLLAQLYTNWLLVIIGDGADMVRVPALEDEPTRVRRLAVQSAAEAACALEVGTNDWIVDLCEGQLLEPRALFCFAAAAASSPRPAVIYVDEDAISPQGERAEPWFKPRWSPETYRAHDYISSACACDARMVAELSAAGSLGAPVAELLASLIESNTTGRIRHVPQVLMHRTRPVVSQRDAAVTALPSPLPRVEVIIPTRDRPDLLEACITTLREQTDYPDFGVTIIDNGSQDARALALLDQYASLDGVRVLRYPGAFNFAAINNIGVRETRSELLCFLNDDTRVQHAEWLRELVRHAASPEIGAVGPMLLYPDGTIQHAGVVLGLGPLGLAGHLHRGRSPADHELNGMVDRVRNSSVVTGACLVVRRSAFEEVGGFDERFTVCFNDVDLCLKLRARGLRNVWTPDAVLWHDENISQAKRDDSGEARYWREAALFESEWAGELRADGCFNPNLALLGEQWALADRPRKTLQ